MTVRRSKSYSAQTGYVYQYHFEGQQPTRGGTAYVFIVSRDRKHSFPLTVRLPEEALAAWAARHGRPLSGTEQYAAVKMRLFHAFDELENLDRATEVNITANSVDDLLAELDIQ